MLFLHSSPAKCNTFSVTVMQLPYFPKQFFFAPAGNKISIIYQKKEPEEAGQRCALGADHDARSFSTVQANQFFVKVGTDLGWFQ